jgi:hypothetical protein
MIGLKARQINAIVRADYATRLKHLGRHVFIPQGRTLYFRR